MFKCPSPPPEYIVVETKYGTSQLGTPAVGRQMSFPWINQRLDAAVGPDLAKEIRHLYAINPQNVQSVLANVGSDGSITYTLLDLNANKIGTFIK